MIVNPVQHLLQRHLLRLLLALDVVLACALAALWWPSESNLRQRRWSPPAALAPVLSEPEGGGLPARSALPVSSFLLTLERPIFSPNRRPPPVAAVAAAPEPDPLANIQLQGLYSAAGGGGVFARVDGKDRRIAVGGSLGPWTVQSVAGREVTLARGEQTQVLRLLPSRLTGEAPAPAAPSAPSAPPAPPPVQSLPPGAMLMPLPPGAMPMPLPAQVEDPALRQEQERQEVERARLAERNARRAEQGFPPVKE